MRMRMLSGGLLIRHRRIFPSSVELLLHVVRTICAHDMAKWLCPRTGLGSHG